MRFIGDRVKKRRDCQHQEASPGDRGDVDHIRRSIKDHKKSVYITNTLQGAPLIVTLTTFMLYVLSDPNHVLTAEKVFGTVAVFNVVRIPMMQFPRFEIR